MAAIQENTSNSTPQNRIKKQPTKVDLTAMVDLAFLLITFFMFTTTLLKPKVMDIILPVSGTSRPVDDDVVMTILLAPKNIVLYYFGNPEEASKNPQAVKATNIKKIREVRRILLEKKKAVAAMGKPIGIDKNGNNKTTILIKATDSSLYGNMVDILDEMHITDIKYYALLPISEPEKELVDNAMKNIIPN